MHAIFTRLLLTASATFLLVSPLLAESPMAAGASDGRASPPNVAAWVKAVNAKVEGAMVGPSGVSGAVTARFRRGDDGRAAEIQVDPATPALEHAVRITLQRLRHLPSMPRGVDPHQRVKVQLLFDDGTDTEAFEAKRHAMLAAADEANRRIAEGSTETILALSGTP